MALDRKYVSRYGAADFAIKVYRDGVPGVADGDVTASLIPVGSTTPAWTRTATLTSEAGVYEVALTSVDTQIPGEFSLRFDYAIDAVPQIFGYDIEIGPASPAYDSMPATWRAAVDSVWSRFADLFDSPYGGPNLQTYAQTNFGRNRIAQLMTPALNRLNSATSGHQSYPLGGEFPFASWGGLLEQSLYIEVIKHFIRSFVEQPEVILGTAVSRVDRRDYMQRWREVLDMETTEFERDLSRYKMANMGLGNVSVLVAGGAFGNWGPTVNAGGAGEAAARGYFSVNRAH